MSDKKPEAAKITTIKDVAHKAAVSVGTVSKVLNHTGNISEKTRERVLQVAQELQFRPNVLAKSLHSGRSGTIGLLTNDNFGRFSMPIAEGLDVTLSRHGIGVLMCNATDDPMREQQHIDQLLAKQVDGLIVTARRTDKRPPINLHGIALPLIYVFSQTDAPQARSLLSDDEGGALMATSYLTAKGRSKIVHVTGPAHFEAVRLREKGFRRALMLLGLSPVEILYGSWSEQWGRLAASTVIASGKPFDAIFCGNDQIGRGVISSLRVAGYNVPNDIAVMGYDNWSVIAAASQPPLSSVDMNLNQLGMRAGNDMLAMMSGKPLTGTERLPCSLVLRQSTEYDLSEECNNA